MTTIISNINLGLSNSKPVRSQNTKFMTVLSQGLSVQTASLLSIAPPKNSILTIGIIAWLWTQISKYDLKQEFLQAQKEAKINKKAETEAGRWRWR